MSIAQDSTQLNSYEYYECTECGVTKNQQTAVNIYRQKFKIRTRQKILVSTHKYNHNQFIHPSIHPPFAYHITGQGAPLTPSDCRHKPFAAA